jgi:hypothetical protein
VREAERAAGEEIDDKIDDEIDNKIDAKIDDKIDGKIDQIEQEQVIEAAPKQSTASPSLEKLSRL